MMNIPWPSPLKTILAKNESTERTCRLARILSYFTVPSVIFLLIFPALSYLQVLVGESAVPAIHRLEQVSTEEKVGSLAENLLEALRDHPDVEKKVSWFLELLKQMLCKIRACAWAFPIWLSFLHLSLASACWGDFSRSSRVDELPFIWREFKFLLYLANPCLAYTSLFYSDNTKSSEFPVNIKLQTWRCSFCPPQQIRISPGTSYITLNNKNPRERSEMLPVSFAFLLFSIGVRSSSINSFGKEETCHGHERKTAWCSGHGGR